MDEESCVESDPCRLFQDIGMLITEERIPQLSAKGRTEGPHCPLLDKKSKHTCNDGLQMCRSANLVKSQLSSLWYKSVPACIDVLLYPDCCHGEMAANEVDQGQGTRDDNYIMLEQWTIQVTGRRTSEPLMCGRSLLQAIRSYLFFSQLSAWYNQTMGKQPHTVIYRVSVPGESDLNLFPDPPISHTFPFVPINKTLCLKVSSMVIPRSDSIPYVVCHHDHTLHVHRKGRDGAVCAPVNYFNELPVELRQPNSPTTTPGFTYSIEGASDVYDSACDVAQSCTSMQSRTQTSQTTANWPIDNTRKLNQQTGAIPKQFTRNPNKATKNYLKPQPRETKTPPSDLNLNREQIMKTMKSPTVLVTEQLPQQHVYFAAQPRPPEPLKFCPRAQPEPLKDVPTSKLIEETKDAIGACGRPMSPAEIEQYLWLLKPQNRRSESPDTVSPSSVDSSCLSPMYLSLNRDPFTSLRLTDSMCSTSSNESNGTSSPARSPPLARRGRQKSLKVIPSYERKCLIGRMSDSPSPSPTRVSRRELPRGCDPVRKVLRPELENENFCCNNSNGNNESTTESSPYRDRGIILSSSESDVSLPECNSGSSSSLNVPYTGAICDNNSEIICLEKAFSNLHITPPGAGCEKTMHIPKLHGAKNVNVIPAMHKQSTAPSSTSKTNLTESDLHSSNGVCDNTPSSSVDAQNGHNRVNTNKKNLSNRNTASVSRKHTNGYTDIVQSATTSISSENGNSKLDYSTSPFCSIQPRDSVTQVIKQQNGTTHTPTSGKKLDILNDALLCSNGTPRSDNNEITNGCAKLEPSCDITAATLNRVSLPHPEVEAAQNEISASKTVILDKTQEANQNGSQYKTAVSNNVAKESQNVNVVNCNAGSDPTSQISQYTPSASDDLGSQTVVRNGTTVNDEVIPSFPKKTSLLKNLMKKDLISQQTLDRDCHGNHVPTEQERSLFHKSAKVSAQMVFHRTTGLPLQSSPAPVKRNSRNFNYDANLSTPRAIKNAVSCSILDSSESEADENSAPHRKLSVSAPASTQRLLGNFEESILNGRIEPVGVVEGFTAEIGASGSFCPKHIKRSVTAYWFSLSDDNAPSPYLGHISLEGVGKKGYHVPNKGTVQVTLFNPNKTVVKMFVVMYDLSDMPPNCQTFLRQRTLYMPVSSGNNDDNAIDDEEDEDEMLQIYLRYLIHLRFNSSKSGRIYLHTDIRLIFARDKFEFDPRVATYELRSFTEGPVNPKFSPIR